MGTLKNDCVDIKDSTANQFESEELGNTFLMNPELLKEEEKLKKENEDRDEAEEEKLKADEYDLTPEQRYKKLCSLLNKSKFYSNFLLEKMEKEDEESKKLKSKN